MSDPTRAARWLALICLLLLGSVATANATPKQVVINSPVDGIVSSSPFESPPHHIIHGQWSFDIHTSWQARPVYARFGAANGSLRLSITERVSTSCRSGGGGWRVTVRAWVDGVVVGDVYYLHLDNARGLGDIANGTQIGTTALNASSNNACWTGPHVHVEGINRSGSASCAQRIGLGASLNGGSAIGVIGGDWVGANNQACPAAAFNVGPGAPSIGEGSFINIAGRPEIYRIAGGAPIYVSTWAFYGGSQPTTAISQAQFNQLRQYPADGTAINDGTHVYIIAGGAPVYVASWNNVGGPRANVRIDPAAVANAGAGGVWNHLRQRPADGTFIVGGGHVYVIAGGAPIYVNAWDAVGGVRPVTHVDGTAIANAGGGAPWNHLAWAPANGTTIVGHGRATVYVIAGGAPIPVTDWNRIGGSRPVTAVSQAAIDRAGGEHVWGHLRARPADGTFITATGGHVFRFAGGAPIWVSDWANVGGQRPTTAVDMAALDRAGGTGVWRFVADRPADGTILRSGPTGAFYRTTNGVPQRLPGSAERAVVVGPDAIANAGRGGFWRFLRAAPAPAPAVPTPPAPASPTPPGSSSGTPTAQPPTSSAPGGTSGTSPQRLSSARIRSATTTARGARVNVAVRAKVGRTFAGRRVLVQRLVNGRWRALTATKVQRSGAIRAKVALNRGKSGLRGVRSGTKITLRLAFPKTATKAGRIGPSRTYRISWAR